MSTATKNNGAASSRDALLAAAGKKPVHRAPVSYALPVVQENPFATSEKDKGVVYWRSMMEKMDSEELRLSIEREFPMGAAEMSDGTSRRNFLQLVGASVALAGAAACGSPREKIVAYTRNPSGVSPGSPQHYATALTYGGYATGTLVTSWDGRPTKVEGNPDHPISKGGSGTLDQAAILGLYDPQRAKEIKQRGSSRAWKTFLAEVAEWGPALEKDGGAKLAFLMEPNASPLVAELRKKIQQRFPKARFYAHAPLAKDNVYEGAKIALGKAVETHLHLDKARVILSLDADLFDAVGEKLRLAREWAENRVPQKAMNRLYVVEPALTVTGMSADHRARAKPSELVAFARALAAELKAEGAAAPAAGEGRLSGKLEELVKAVAKDLAAHRGQGVVVAGERLPAAVHALVHAINGALGNLGQTVTFTEASVEVAAGPAELEKLLAEIEKGQVEVLVTTAYNPVYTSPGQLLLPQKLKALKELVYLGSYEDETYPLATWFIPAAHPLETWGDARAVDGTISIVQPLTQTLWGGISEVELLACFTGQSDLSGHEMVRAHWREKAGSDQTFDQWLAEGVVPNTALPSLDLQANAAAATSAMQLLQVSEGVFEVAFAKDYKAQDGRYANNAWLQELPDPVTKLTWDNVAMVSPETARKLGLRFGRYDNEMATVVDVCEIGYGGVKMEVAVLAVPGHADDVITLPLGYGRQGAERVARGVGFNSYLLRSAKTPWFDAGATLVKLEKTHDLAVTQEHWSMEGRKIAIDATLPEYEENKAALVELQRGGALSARPEPSHPPATLIPPVDYSQAAYAWGMTVDLSRCTGCSACVLACQAENNIPVVGKESVKKSREMHWLRIDRYFAGDEHDPKVLNQPMACQHCESAPCEYVCPVNATLHSDEGLNDMVYNRCVGTRYCSNNCPYKVRRFNFLHFSANKSATEKMAMNPDVTVRARGVMEKCTYCVQRIERARIHARSEGRDIREGEIKSACQQACPTHAITFGNLNDPSSRVAVLAEDNRRYDVLSELGTRPRTGYLARITNPNPTLNAAHPEEGHGGEHH